MEGTSVEVGGDGESLSLDTRNVFQDETVQNAYAFQGPLCLYHGASF